MFYQNYVRTTFFVFLGKPYLLPHYWHFFQKHPTTKKVAELSFIRCYAYAYISDAPINNTNFIQDTPVLSLTNSIH